MKHLHPLHAIAAAARAPHRNGRTREALPHGRQATATGYPKAALRPNPGLSPLAARTARTTLKSPEATR
ncbi:hypothetical protein ACWCRF_02380 [Streptomyces sp. NPDC002405]